MGTIRVLIADDIAIDRAGVRAMLSLAPDIEVVGEATSAMDAYRQALTLRPDVVMMDLLWYGDRNAGATAIRRIKQELPDTAVLAMTVYDELIDQASTSGADMSLDKSALTNPEIVADRIREVSALCGAFARVEEHLPEALSDRERKVLGCIAAGQRDQEIAQMLHLSVGQIKREVASILVKLGAKNRAAAIHIANTHRLIP